MRSGESRVHSLTFTDFSERFACIVLCFICLNTWRQRSISKQETTIIEVNTSTVTAASRKTMFRIYFFSFSSPYALFCVLFLIYLFFCPLVQVQALKKIAFAATMSSPDERTATKKSKKQILLKMDKQPFKDLLRIAFVLAFITSSFMQCKESDNNSPIS